MLRLLRALFQFNQSIQIRRNSKTIIAIMGMLKRTTHRDESTLVNAEKRRMNQEMLSFFDNCELNMIKKIKLLSGHDDGNCVFKKIDFFENEADDEEMEDILPSSESDDE